jgi:hypothetical protein
MMILFSFASATSTLGTIKQGSCIEIPQVCASCTYVNLSVQYPNKLIAISNQAMTPNGAGLWTYNFCNTSQLGRYDVSGIGDINSVDTGFSVLWFEVTPNGKQMDVSQSILFGFIFLIIVGLLTFSVYGLSNSNQVEWTIFYICSTYILSFCMFFVAWLFSDNYLWQTPILASVFWIIWLILAICFFPFIIGVSGYILKLQAETLMMDEYTSQGYSKEDAKSLTKARRKR